MHYHYPIQSRRLAKGDTTSICDGIICIKYVGLLGVVGNLDVFIKACFVELLKYVGGTWWVVFEMLCKQWIGFSWVDYIHPKSDFRTFSAKFL